MRKITKQAVQAFLDGRNFTLGNTAVNQRIGGMEMLLHGNIIARDIGDGLEVNLCGWNTPTTRERLNGFPNVSVYTRKGVPYLNGEEMPTDGWVTVKSEVTA